MSYIIILTDRQHFQETSAPMKTTSSQHSLKAT